MLFFQIALLAGYAYAHLLSGWLVPRKQAIVHLLVLIVAVATLPVTPDVAWKPSGDEDPMIRILMLLLASVGLPYTVLASTGPLIQNWYGQRLPNQSPWRLYALSNVGSLLGLLTFPFVFEPAFTSDQQSLGWSVAFVVFAFLCGGTAINVFRNANSMAGSVQKNSTDSKKAAVDEGVPQSRFQVVYWLSLPALASMMLLAMTHYLCQDVAVVPFLWVAPLALYLLSFIICFDSEKWYRPTFFTLMTMLAIMMVMATIGHEQIDDWLATPNGLKILETVGLPDAEFETIAEKHLLPGVDGVVCRVWHLHDLPRRTCPT